MSGEWRVHCNDCWILEGGLNVKLVEQWRPVLYYSALWSFQCDKPYIHILYKIGYVFLVNDTFVAKWSKEKISEMTAQLQHHFWRAAFDYFTLHSDCTEKGSEWLFRSAISSLAPNTFIFSCSSVPNSINGGQSCVTRNTLTNYTVST